MKIAVPVAASAVAVAAMLGGAAWAWPHAPAVVVTHWGAAGTPDGWSPKGEAFVALPALAVVMMLALAGIPAIMPRNGPLERSERAYGTVWVVVMAALLGAQIMIVASAAGLPLNVPRACSLLVGGVMAVLGEVMGKMRYNYVMGLRTPWTLASERVWDRTHRLAGPLVMVGGLVLAGSAIWAPAQALLGCILACTLVPVALGTAYSYVAARQTGAV